MRILRHQKVLAKSGRHGWYFFTMLGIIHEIHENSNKSRRKKEDDGNKTQRMNALWNIFFLSMGVLFLVQINCAFCVCYDSNIGCCCQSNNSEKKNWQLRKKESVEKRWSRKSIFIKYDFTGYLRIETFFHSLRFFLVFYSMICLLSFFFRGKICMTISQVKCVICSSLWRESSWKHQTGNPSSVSQYLFILHPKWNILFVYFMR